MAFCLRRCPPGHGDIYPALLGTGMLRRLREKGINYVFVSNSDNLGATLDLDILAYFAQSGNGFLMEVRMIRFRFLSEMQLYLAEMMSSIKCPAETLETWAAWQTPAVVQSRLARGRDRVWFASCPTAAAQCKGC